MHEVMQVSFISILPWHLETNGTIYKFLLCSLMNIMFIVSWGKEKQSKSVIIPEVNKNKK